jgi:hypothetical protein
MPHGKYAYFVDAQNVIDVIAGSFEQNPTRTRYRRPSIHTAEIGCLADDGERCSTNLGVRFRSGLDGLAHRRRRSSFRIADAGLR